MKVLLQLNKVLVLEFQFSSSLISLESSSCRVVLLVSCFRILDERREFRESERSFEITEDAGKSVEFMNVTSPVFVTTFDVVDDRLYICSHADTTLFFR